MNIFKKQGVAWVITIVMIVAAIGIGRAKAPDANGGFPGHDQDHGPGTETFFVYDDANVLSAGVEKKLSDRNRDLYSSMDVVVACVTTNYGRDDLYDYALDYAADIGLDVYDFIVVLDISGDNYWLIQGSGLVDQFTDKDCDAYAYDCMEQDFVKGKYGDALLELTDALADWYDDHYVG